MNITEQPYWSLKHIGWASFSFLLTDPIKMLSLAQSENRRHLECRAIGVNPKPRGWGIEHFVIQPCLRLYNRLHSKVQGCEMQFKIGFVCHGCRLSKVERTSSDSDSQDIDTVITAVCAIFLTMNRSAINTQHSIHNTSIHNTFL